MSRGHTPTHDAIRVRGARTNNLRGVDVDIPKKKLTVVTGLSGSGKSSLAFDTVAAESQRLLNATYPGFVQNLMPHLPRPDVDTLEGLSASIVVDQAPMGANPRSTVGTATDAWSLLRQLYAVFGDPSPGGPDALSFNSPTGSCRDCDGTGREARLDVAAVLDDRLSLDDGAITFPNFAVGSLFWKVYVRSGHFDNARPVGRFTPGEREHLLTGTGPSVDTGSHPMAYEGVLTKIRRLYLSKEPAALKPAVREALERAATTGPCPGCEGTRLNPAARACTVAGVALPACHAMSADRLAAWLGELAAPPGAERLVKALASIAANLGRVGLGYLTLDRPTSTLSGGEAQRIRTVLHLDSALTDMTYVFDEPAAGLHAHDTRRVADLLRDLRDKGNTVIVVEHHREVIRSADHVIDLGPGAGRSGGTITFEGTPRQLLTSDTATGRAISAPVRLTTSPRTPEGTLSVRGASRHNLADVDVEIGLGVLTCVTGVAGAGKSSLLACLPSRDDLVRLDQTPIRGSRRSTPATYTGVMDVLRDLYAAANGVKPALFSANSAGACDGCGGLGRTYVEIPGTPAVASRCSACDGRRYRADVLALTLDGRSIADTLDLVVDDAAEAYAATVAAPTLELLRDVGLGYLTLGQPLSTLSGGERQRLRLATEMRRRARLASPGQDRQGSRTGADLCGKRGARRGARAHRRPRDGAEGQQACAGAAEGDSGPKRRFSAAEVIVAVGTPVQVACRVVGSRSLVGTTGRSGRRRRGRSGTRCSPT